MPEITEKVLELDRARVFRTAGFVAERGVGSAASAFFLNPVEVLSEDGRRIGWAALSFATWALDCIRADLVFDYASPERLEIETGSRPLYAVAMGVMELSVAPFEIKGRLPMGRGDAGDVHITSILISSTPSYVLQPPLGSAEL